MKKIYILCMLLLSFHALYAQQGVKGDLALRNAYQISKVLSEQHFLIDSLTEDQQGKLLGAIFWYADVQDESNTADKIDALTDKLKYYPKLKGFVNQLLFRNVTVDSFISNRIKVDTLTGISNNLIQKLKEKKHTYDSLDNALIKDMALYQADSQKLKDVVMATRRSGMDSMTYVTRIDSLINYYTLLLSADSVKPLLVKERNNLTGYQPKAISNADSLFEMYFRKQVNAREAVVTDDKNHIADFRKTIYQFLKDQQEPLAKYISYIGVKKVDFDYGGSTNIKAAETYNSTTQIEMQTLLYQATAGSSSFRLPSESEMIDALAIYIARRVKQEGVMWFFETMTKNAKRYQLISTFFPNTIALLNGREVYEVPNMGAQWQYALSKDFITMPANVFSSDWFHDHFPAANEYKSFISGTCAIADLLNKRYAFREMIKELYLQDYDKTSNQLQFHDLIGLLYAVNSELFVPDSAANYRLLKYEDYRLMNKDQLSVMISLADMKYGHAFRRVLAFKGDVIDITNTDYSNRLRVLLGKIEATINQIDKSRLDFQKKQDQLDNKEEKDWKYSVYNVYSTLNQLFSLFSDTTIASPGVIAAKKALKVTGDVYEIYNLINRKNFSGATQNMIALLDTLFYGNYAGIAGAYHVNRDALKKLADSTNGKVAKKVTQQIDDYVDHLQRRDASKDAKLRASITDSITVDSTLASRWGITVKSADNISFMKNSQMAALVFTNDREAIQLIRRLAAFLNDAALAQNDQQLSKVVESYALPPGSYKRKRGNWYSFDLNAFVGVYGGYETLGNKTKSDGWVYGLSVPIGFSYSKTFGKRLLEKDELTTDEILNPGKIKSYGNRIYRRRPLTVTLTASIIDIGAVVSYRMGGSQDSTLPQQIKWSQVISPGMSLAVSIPGTPLVGMAGVEYTPQLRSFKSSDEQYNAFRFYIACMVDLPLANLWERRRIVR
jgi:hypothetical protein